MFSIFFRSTFMEFIPVPKFSASMFQFKTMEPPKMYSIAKIVQSPSKNDNHIKIANLLWNLHFFMSKINDFGNETTY